MFEDIITIYHFNEDNSYSRTIIENVYWDECKKSNTIKSAMTNTDTVTIIIPTASDIELKEGKDLVVKGICDFTGTEKVVKTLCEEYKAKTIMIVDRHLHGGLSNIELSCK